MRLSKLKAVATTVALICAGTANAALVPGNDEDGSVFASIWNATDDKSIVFDTGLDIGDFTGGVPVDQNWSLDLSGLTIDGGDTVLWNMTATNDSVSTAYGLLTSCFGCETGDINNSVDPLGVSGKLIAYASSVNTSTPGFASVVGSATTGMISRVFVPGDLGAYHGSDGWQGDFGTASLWDNHVALGDMTSLFLSKPDGSFVFSTIDTNVTAMLATNGTLSIATSAVPVPAAVWLFGSGLAGLVGVARRKHATRA
jgi:hypothetical protein